MQAVSNEIFESLTPAEPKSMYYADQHNTEIQVSPAILDTRFSQTLPSAAFGSSSVLTYNPQQGVSDVVLTLVLPAQAYTGWALPRGWGAQFIDSVQVRIGGSSQYNFSGAQLMLECLEEIEDSGKKDQFFSLAGAECLTAADFSDEANRTAYVYLKSPWNSPSARGKPLPLPTDLLTQPVQWVVRFKPAADVFLALTGATPSALPSGFSEAKATFRGITLEDSGELLARTHNMNEKAYMFPLTNGFQQTEFTTRGALGESQGIQVNLTGLRAGEVSQIRVWAVKDSDLKSGNAWAWQPASDVTLSINGLVYYNSPKTSSQMWALVDHQTSATVNSTSLSDNGDGTASAIPSVASWTRIPLGQVADQEAYEPKSVSGKAILNSVVNLQLSLPAVDSTDYYHISAEYKYRSALLFTAGSCDYIF